MPRGGTAASRAELAERLRERRDEIEQAILTRAHAIADPTETSDALYAEGLRTAVSAAIDYGIEALERGEGRAPSPPPILLMQARVAARSGIGLDTVLRRYFAGYTLLGDFLVTVAREQELLNSDELRRVLRDQAALFDRLLGAVSDEHRRALEELEVRSSDRRRLQRVQRLLAGELLDTSELDYEMDAWHLGLVATGPNVGSLLRDLARALDRVSLLVQPDNDTIWAWFGGRRPLGFDALHEQLSSVNMQQIHLAVGEPGKGLAGWQLTHRQAAAASRVAQRRNEQSLRYADVALLASALQDELLITSLREVYVAPLETEHDGGATLRKTLHAYLAAAGNVSSAAARLGVNRNTVASRIRVVEGKLGRPIDSCTAELALALELHRLREGFSQTSGTSPG
jgi:hypothetical protein